jgi:hypothetical protein
MELRVDLHDRNNLRTMPQHEKWDGRDSAQRLTEKGTLAATRFRRAASPMKKVWVWWLHDLLWCVGIPQDLHMEAGKP